MGANHPLANRYREVAIKTANPLQLVVILYDGAIQALQEAQEHINRNDIPGRARCINRSVAIISELQACLNFSAGGEIAGSLDRLYNYMKQRIFNANVEQRSEPLNEVVLLLDNLRSAWGTLAAQSTAPDAAPSHSVPAGALINNAAPAPAISGSLDISG